VKKDITIKIADNLTPQQEVAAISKKLNQKILAGGGANKEQKRIGDELNITHLETTIKIVRESKEPVITFCTCNVCQREYQSNTAVFAYTNYGGLPRKIATCSKECLNILVELSPTRISGIKKSIKPVRLF
jgi:hypothetical protein